MAKRESMRSLVESMDRVLAESLCPQADRDGWSPDFTLKEDPRKFTLVAKLPGFERSDVRVDVTERAVTVSGSRRRSRREHGRVSESEVSFHRVFGLPSAVKSDEAKAAFSSGTLTVELPKQKETQVRRIEIK